MYGGHNLYPVHTLHQYLPQSTDEFWPAETGSPQTYGPVKVEMTGESNDRGVTVRDFTVKNVKVSYFHVLWKGE